MSAAEIQGREIEHKDHGPQLVGRSGDAERVRYRRVEIEQLGEQRSGGGNSDNVVLVRGARVDNATFNDRCKELGIKFLRVVNVHDSAPKIPGFLFNEKFQMTTRPTHAN